MTADIHLVHKTQTKHKQSGQYCNLTTEKNIQVYFAKLPEYCNHKNCLHKSLQKLQVKTEGKEHKIQHPRTTNTNVSLVCLIPYNTDHITPAEL